ncbi:FAD-dependent monooxygenase, partial [Streptomyces sp. URMC 129]|uniref:FAD-dependent monooxygenase n=1 Tax=Streptomyces sp. URMC 129 TaxID=3423407 RepID=UPI003F1AD59E
SISPPPVRHPSHTTEASMPELHVPVLVVGAGPAGLTSALALSRYGIDTLLVEKHAGTAHTPRAHIVNQRTVEIMRHLGIEDRLLAAATPQEMMRNNLWVTSLAGREVARLEAWGTGADRAAEYRAASPSPMVNCPQTIFEPILLEAVSETGCDVRFQHEFLSFQEDDDSLVSTVRDRRTGEILTIRSQYLIGADGARGRVLGQAGLKVEGPSRLAHAANVWFRADLARYLAHRPGVLTWNVAPGPLPAGRLGTLICHRPFTEFVLVLNYEPGKDDPTAADEAELVRRIHACIGDDTIPIEILGRSAWTVNAQVAPAYSAGRVFCMGDAVHRHPPTNGLGLNMSVADAYNLAWKLALVLRGQVGPALLDSYSSERQPVGAAGVRRAITSRAELAEVGTALGYAPGQSEEEGQRALDQLYAPGPEGERRRAALRRAVALTDYQFNAHGTELGYRYPDGAVAADGTPEPTPSRDPELYYQPTTRPGARLPHARLGQGTAEFSTLDLPGGLRFALITGVGGEEWHAAAKAAADATGVEIDVHLIGGRDGILDLYGEWAARREVSEDGCVLVRPDRRVAWRAHRIRPAAADELTDALRQVLGQSATR